MRRDITDLSRTFLELPIAPAEDIQVTAKSAFLNNRLMEKTGVDMIIQESIESVLKITHDVLTRTGIKQVKNNLTKAAMALVIPLLALPIATPVQAETVSKKSKIEKQPESNSGTKKQNRRLLFNINDGLNLLVFKPREIVIGHEQFLVMS